MKKEESFMEVFLCTLLAVIAAFIGAAALSVMVLTIMHLAGVWFG